MAQIIQHKRGLLEGLDGVTPNVGELLVVTGSSISALADGLVFVGNSSSDITSVNRIITGSSTPDVTGGDYDARLDGIPFYNTTDKKLEILAKGGNTNVVFTTNSLDLNDSGIVSSSAQVSALAGTSNNTITLSPGAGLAAIGDFTLNQASDETITIGVDGILEDLDTLGAPASDGQFIVATGAGAFAYESAATARTSMGVDAAGTDNSTDVTLANTNYLSISGQAITGGTIPVGSGGTGATTAGAARTALGLEIGTDVQAYDAQLADLAGLAVTDSGIIVGNGTNFVLESGATARTSLGVDAAGTDNSGVTVTASSVSKGGTTFNKLALGTTSTTALAGNTSLLALGSTSSTALAGDTTVDDVSVSNLRTALTGISTSTTIGDATDVTITTSGDLTVTGDLIVNGDTVQTNVTTMNVEDNIINLNFGGSATNGGLYVGDVTGTTTSGSILWDGTNDYWIAGAKDAEARVIVGNGTDTAGTITKFSADGVITDSIITESGTTVTISNDLILNGLTASTFLHADSSKQLTSVTTSTDGDILVSNGSGTFTATNTIDGGTF